MRRQNKGLEEVTQTATRPFPPRRWPIKISRPTTFRHGFEFFRENKVLAMGLYLCRCEILITVHCSRHSKRLPALEHHPSSAQYSLSFFQRGCDFYRLDLAQRIVICRKFSPSEDRILSNSLIFRPQRRRSHSCRNKVMARLRRPRIFRSSVDYLLAAGG